MGCISSTPSSPTPPPSPSPSPPASPADVTGSLADVNRETIALILQCRDQIRSNPDLLSLINDYFDFSLQTLDFLSALVGALNGARDSHMVLQAILQKFEEERQNNAKLNYGETLRELRGFREAGDLFTEEVLSLFGSVYDKQLSIFENIKTRKRKLDRKLKQVRVYRKVSGIIFAGAFISIVVCFAVAAAVCGPHLVAGLAGLGPVGTVGVWFDTMWKRYEEEVKSERELIGGLNVGSFIFVKDLQNIRVLVDRLEVEFESLLTNADMVLRHEDAVCLVVEEIGKSVDVFAEMVRELMKHAEMCRQDVRKASTVILQKIIKYPRT